MNPAPRPPALRHALPGEKACEMVVNGESVKLCDGNIVIAAITSCTNTSNPFVMLGAGLVAKKAVEKGLRVPAFVKNIAGARFKSGHRLSERRQAACRSGNFRLSPGRVRMYKRASATAAPCPLKSTKR